MTGPKTSKPAFDAASGDPDKARFPALAGLVAESSKKGHVLLGEPHEDGMLAQTYAFLAANPEMFRQAAQNGVKNLVLEMPTAFQEAVDGYMSGKAGREQLEREIFLGFQTQWLDKGEKMKFTNHIADTVENAKKAGMKVHMADARWKDVELSNGTSGLNPETIQKAKALEDQILKAYRESGSKEPILDFSRNYGKSISEDQREYLSRLDNSILAQKQWERINDTEQYDLIRSVVPPTEKIMAVVGVRHIDSPEIPLDKNDPRYGENPKGLADRLREEGGHPVTTVGLWNNAKQENALSSGPSEKIDYIIKVGGTDFSAFFDEGKVLKNTLAPPTPNPSPKTGLDYTSPGFNG